MKRKNKEGTLIHRIHTLAQVGILLIFFGNCSDMGEGIEGCTNSEACNFNPDATLDDGTCALVEDICGVCGGAGVEPEDCCQEGESPDDCGICGGNNSSCINYSTEIQPIFSANCTMCHGGSHFTGLDLTSYDGVMEGNSNNGPVIEVNESANSLLWQKISAGVMPPSTNLTSSEVNSIAQWINEGAQDN